MLSHSYKFHSDKSISILEFIVNDHKFINKQVTEENVNANNAILVILDYTTIVQLKRGRYFHHW